MRGALLGLLIELASLLARVLVPLYAITGRYPAWMLTPDDPASPFGQYEESVRKVYARFGRYIGDVYWLGWRNVAYGLAYRFKPAKYKGRTDYSALRRRVRHRGLLTVYRVDGLPLYQLRLGPLELLAGWMVRGVVLDPYTQRQPVNMEFRPLLSLRKAG